MNKISQLLIIADMENGHHRKAENKMYRDFTNHYRLLNAHFKAKR